MKHETHVVTRTSPLGQLPFKGRCLLCGATDLTFKDVLKPCPNPKRIPSSEALIMALEAGASTLVVEVDD